MEDMKFRKGPSDLKVAGRTRWSLNAFTQRSLSPCDKVSGCRIYHPHESEERIILRTLESPKRYNVKGCPIAVKVPWNDRLKRSAICYA